jgi:hypothetical protein
MHGRVRRQPADRLLPLPAGADRPPSSRLVREDDRMDEALEEVALVVTRGAPGKLERLVRGEPLAGACELEAVLVFSADSVIFARRQMATILLVGVDLFLRGKLEGLLPGHHFVTAEGVDPPDLVIADVARIDPNDVADNFPEVPLLGFTNHMDTAGLRRAHEAGFDQVVAKSALFERTEELIGGLLTPVE